MGCLHLKDISVFRKKVLIKGGKSASKENGIATKMVGGKLFQKLSRRFFSKI